MYRTYHDRLHKCSTFSVDIVTDSVKNKSLVFIMKKKQLQLSKTACNISV